MNMHKKQLPKVVTQTADDMRKAGAVGLIASATSSVSSRAEQRDDADAHAPARVLSGIEAAQRRSRANAIVERYANLSVLGGAIPLPLANVAGVTIIILQ